MVMQELARVLKKYEVFVICDEVYSEPTYIDSLTFLRILSTGIRRYYQWFIKVSCYDRLETRFLSSLPASLDSSINQESSKYLVTAAGDHEPKSMQPLKP